MFSQQLVKLGYEMMLRKDVGPETNERGWNLTDEKKIHIVWVSLFQFDGQLIQGWPGKYDLLVCMKL